VAVAEKDGDGCCRKVGYYPGRGPVVRSSKGKWSGLTSYTRSNMIRAAKNYFLNFKQDFGFKNQRIQILLN
jgi:hypothetical protein